MGSGFRAAKTPSAQSGRSGLRGCTPRRTAQRAVPTILGPSAVCASCAFLWQLNHRVQAQLSTFEMESIPHLERGAAAVQKHAALGTFARLFPHADAMPRGHGTDGLVMHPAKTFATADDEIIERSGKGRRWLVARAGSEGRGFEFPIFEFGRGGGGDFEVGHGIVQFPAIKTVNGLHGQMRSARRAPGHGDAISAFAAFEQVGAAHAG
jgi:hypothetical protein